MLLAQALGVCVDCMLGSDNGNSSRYSRHDNTKASDIAIVAAGLSGSYNYPLGVLPLIYEHKYPKSITG